MNVAERSVPRTMIIKLIAQNKLQFSQMCVCARARACISFDLRKLF